MQGRLDHQRQLNVKKKQENREQKPLWLIPNPHRRQARLNGELNFIL
jgi:hypothetical protein